MEYHHDLEMTPQLAFFLGDTREEIDHPPDNEYCILYIFIMRKIETAVSIILVNLVKDLAK